MHPPAAGCFAEEDLLPLSGLQHLIYCERRAALVHLEGIWSDNVATIQGTHLHERADEPDSELRGGILIVRGLALRSLRLGLTGRADVMEFHRQSADSPHGPPARLCVLPGREGGWRPFPVEYKRGRLRREPAYLVQLCAQALCLEETLGVFIESGAVFFGETRRRLDVVFDASLRNQTESAAARLHELIHKGQTPPPAYGPKCEKCSLHDLCQPGPLARNMHASAYLARAMRPLSDTNTVGDRDQEDKTR